MKRFLVVTLFLILSLLPLAGLAQGYVAISQIEDQLPARWMETYVTKWRTISIDVQPVIPKVEKLPILKVVPDLRELDISALPKGWTSELNNRGTFSAEHGFMDQETRDLIDSGVTTSTNYYPPLDMNTAYAKNNAAALKDVIAYLRLTMESMGEDPGQWDYDRPNRVMINTTVGHESDEPLLPGIYAVQFPQKLRGIPLLSHVLSGIAAPKDNEMWAHTGLTFDFRSPEHTSLFGKQVKVTEILAEDVPLCGFDKVKEAIENEIYAGHIRRIFDVELGYALYNEPGKSRTPGYPEFPESAFYAVPVWQVNCYYVKNARGEIRDYTGQDVPERAEIEYETLIVNAQTGILLDHADNRKGCGDYKGFISWEDAGAKQ